MRDFFLDCLHKKGHFSGPNQTIPSPFYPKQRPFVWAILKSHCMQAVTAKDAEGSGLARDEIQ
jgi:hypothetical protein